MRVNLESSVATGSRFKKLRKVLGQTRNEISGAFFHVCLEAYDRRLVVLPIDEIDIAAELDGFALAMVAVGLAESIGSDKVRIHGVKERIKFLKKQVKSGGEGGRKSGESRRKKREASALSSSKHHFKKNEANTLTLTLPPDQSVAATPLASARRPALSLLDCTSRFVDTLGSAGATVIGTLADARKTGLSARVADELADKLNELRKANSVAFEYGAEQLLADDSFGFEPAAGKPIRVVRYVSACMASHRVGAGSSNGTSRARSGDSAEALAAWELVLNQARNAKQGEPPTLDDRSMAIVRVIGWGTIQNSELINVERRKFLDLYDKPEGATE